MRDIDIVIRLLAVVVPEVRIVRETAGLLIASKAVDEVDAVLGVALDAALRVATHDECLVEVAEVSVPICPGAVEGELLCIGVLPCVRLARRSIVDVTR